MKFHNGHWLLREGIGFFSAQHVYEIRKNADELILVVPTSRITSKGDTLGGVNLTVHITAPAEGVIRVRIYHHKGVKKTDPEFELNFPQEVQPLQVEETEHTLTVKSGQLSLEIDTQQWSMTYRHEDTLLTKSGTKDLGLVKEEWTGMAYDHGEKAHMVQQLGISVGETIYGLGERFGTFVKNGQSVEIWNEDGGTSSEQSYKNVPFYLSSRGYGVFVNHPEKVEFEVGTEQVAKVGFSVEGESLDYFLFDGPTMKDVLVKYTYLTGKPSLPPQWTFGLWLSTSFTTSYDEATVMSFIDGMFERDIPLGVFHFDCCWMREFHWTDLVWDSRVFPDPEGMLKRIKAKGVKICVWINSYIAQESVMFDEGVEKGYFVKRPNGDVWQWDMWQPGMALVDFTNPKACAWFQSRLERLLDMGVDCFKTDFGERIPTDVVYYNGADPKKMHNYYTYLYNKTVFELLQRKRGQEDALVFARSATAGGQKFPVHWGGDCWSNYEGMEQSLHGGLSLTSSGFGYWSHDIGGFESTSTPDVYKRWCAFGLLSSHSRLHGSDSYRVPWRYDEEAVDVVRFFTKLKLSLLPYLYSSAVFTAKTGIPMMRSMPLEFNGSLDCQYLDKQYMLGDSLLVAPIFNEESVARYYLPKGRWTSYLTGEVCEGGWREERHGYLSIPLWVRENSVIATAVGTTRVTDPYGEKLELRVYTPGEKKETRIYQEQQELVRIETEAGEREIFLKLEGRTDVTIRLVNCVLTSVEGGSMTVEGNDTIIKPSENCLIGQMR
ncbi:MAG: alpha-xylosidase [Eubacteriales bacterium]|nr:alpha-xylosidase [Eubacteriales bacterium]